MVGVVSNTDLVAAEAESNAASAERVENTLVRDVMTPRALTVSPDAEVKEAAQQMLYAEVHRLFVADDDRLIGVISATDIARAVAKGET